MPIITGADGVALGAALADRVYLGSSLVWEPSEMPPEDWVPVAYVGGTTATSAGAATYDVDLTGIAPQPGDLVVVASGFVSTGLTAGGDPSVVTPGYTEVQRLFSDSTREAHLSVSYKRLTAAETSVTVRGHANADDGSATVVHVWRGIDAASPLDVPAVGATGVGNRRADSPPITPVSEGAVVLTIGGASSGSTASFPTPSGYGNAMQATANPLRLYMLGIASKQLSAPATEDPGNWNGGAAVSEAWAAVTLALRPMPPL